MDQPNNELTSALINSALLKKALSQMMPFGKYKGTRLIDLPEPYLVWFHQQGFPDNQLGQQLALIYEIKLNGLEKLFR